MRYSTCSSNIAIRMYLIQTGRAMYSRTRAGLAFILGARPSWPPRREARTCGRDARAPADQPLSHHCCRFDLDKHFRINQAGDADQAGGGMDLAEELGM